LPCHGDYLLLGDVWALWDITITVAMVMLLKEAFHFICYFVETMHLNKKKGVHSSMTCCVHVDVYNTAK
jgi:hypothetical protein